MLRLVRASIVFTWGCIRSRTLSLSLSLSSHNHNIKYNIQVVVAPTAIHVDLVKRNIRNDISGRLFG